MGQATRYTYDPVGNILSQTDSNGTTRTYSKRDFPPFIRPVEGMTKM